MHVRFLQAVDAAAWDPVKHHSPEAAFLLRRRSLLTPESGEIKTLPFVNTRRTRMLEERVILLKVRGINNGDVEQAESLSVMLGSIYYLQARWR